VKAKLTLEKAAKFSRAIGTLTFAVVSIIATVGNRRRHRTHDKHSQNCECFASCQWCVATALAGK
jgi:hypothetical protein